MKTALMVLHFACEGAVLLLLGRHVMMAENALVIRAVAFGCWCWVVIVGAIVGIWIKNTF